MYLTPFHKTILDRANFERFRRSKVKCGGERPSCDRCSGRRQSCHYARTTKQEDAQRAAAEDARRHTEAIERVAFAPRFRNIRSRPVNPATALGELAAVPILPPPHPGPINQNNMNPVQSNADLLDQNQYDPSQLTRSQPTRSQLTPNQYDPIQSNPSQFARRQSDATQFDPIHFDQNQFDPNHIDEILGDRNPRLNKSSQYRQDADSTFEGLGSPPNEQLQFPRGSQFAQRDYSQLPSGPSQYRGAFDCSNSAPIVQPDGIQPYVNYPSIVYPNVPAWSAWSNSVLPAQSVPRWPNDFGLESTNHAQTPAESSQHVKRAESLAYITAMMPLPENGCA